MEHKHNGGTCPECGGSMGYVESPNGNYWECRHCGYWESA